MDTSELLWLALGAAVCTPFVLHSNRGPDRTRSLNSGRSSDDNYYFIPIEHGHNDHDSSDNDNDGDNE